MSPTVLDPDEQALLEEERDFLLRSLDDLEAERAAGNIDPDDYGRLRDDYTARAAAVLRTLRDGVDARPQAPPVPGRRRVTAVVAVVGFAALAAVLLGRALGERLPGETLTGNDQTRGGEAPAAADDAPSSVEAARAAVERDPTDIEARLGYAGLLLEAGEAAEALRQYDEAARLDPADARPRAASAVVVFEAGLTDEALRRLDEAEAADPAYPETWFFRGLILARGGLDVDGAVEAFERYLALDPEGPYSQNAEVLVEELSSRGERASETGTDRD